MKVFPVVSSVNRARIAANKTFEGALALAATLNERAGNPTLVHMGEELEVEYAGRGRLTLDGVVVPLNPPMGGKSDPHGWVLDKLVENANAPRARARKSSAAKAPAKAPAKSTAKSTATRSRRATAGAAA